MVMGGRSAPEKPPVCNLIRSSCMLQRVTEFKEFPGWLIDTHVEGARITFNPNAFFPLFLVMESHPSWIFGLTLETAKLHWKSNLVINIYEQSGVS